MTTISARNGCAATGAPVAFPTSAGDGSGDRYTYTGCRVATRRDVLDGYGLHDWINGGLSWDPEQRYNATVETWNFLRPLSR